MKQESEYCSIIRNSLIDGFKIPDPSSAYKATIKRAFDGIGLLTENEVFSNESQDLIFICWEAKLLKKLEAFSLKRVEPHQAYYLSSYQRAKNIKSFLLLGVDCSRSDKRSYIFDWDTINKFSLYERGFSFHTKFLEKLPYSEIHNGKFNFNKDFIIDESVLNTVYGDFEDYLNKRK